MAWLKDQLLKNVDWVDNSKTTLVYKFPMNGRAVQFGSKLTVRESQVAIFVNKGQVADVFQPGLHTLSTSNLPILSSLLALPFGFKSPFTCDIYFVSTKQFPNNKWGTTSPIVMRDKEFGTIRVRGYGAYSFRVNDALTFMKELFGTNSSFKTEDIDRQLKSLIVTGITDTIASSGVAALDIAANLYEFSGLAQPVLNEQFKKMGLRIEQFNIEALTFPEEVEKVIDARSAVGIMGGHIDAHMKMQAAAAMRDAAKNEGQGGLGASLGAGIGMAQVFTQAVNTSGGPKVCAKCKTQISEGAKFCPGCGTNLAGGFCNECGAKLPAGAKFCSECGKKQ